MNQQFKKKLYFHCLNDCLMRASQPVLDYPIMDHKKINPTIVLLFIQNISKLTENSVTSV